MGDINRLEAIRKYSEIWADSMDLPSSLKFNPVGATSNPVIILANLSEEHNKHFITEAVLYAKTKACSESRERQVELAVLYCMVSLGVAMAGKIPGLVNTQVDCRAAHDKDKIVSQSLEIVRLYEEQGVPKSRVSIKIPSTWEGIQACRTLTRDHQVNCNMTTMFALPQAVACAEAGALIISPYLNRLSAHFNSEVNPVFLGRDGHVDLPFVETLYNYYKQHGIKTILLGASIKHVEELDLLAGLDAITIFPPLLEKVVNIKGDIEPHFTVAKAKSAPALPVVSYIDDEAKFRKALQDDRRSSEYLEEALHTFQGFDEKLYKLLSDTF